MMRARFHFVQFAFAALIAAVVAASVWAHEVRPAFLELKEVAPGRFEVTWKVPALGGPPLAGDEESHPPDSFAQEDGTRSTTIMTCGCPAPTVAELRRGTLPIHPMLPPDAEIVVWPLTERLEGAEIRRWTIEIPGGFPDGTTIGVHGLEATSIDVLIRIEFVEGDRISHILRPDRPSFIVSREDGEAVGAYFVLGIEHILLGIDHLLFVLGLLLILSVGGKTRVGLLVKTITSFTIAHSVTLALATLGVVNIPGAPVEAVIALSIVFLASELIRSQRGQKGLTATHLWIVAFIFGLLHGFGFAGALSEVGLPPGDIPVALLLFNLGVEAGQLMFVAAVLVLMAVAVQIRSLANLKPSPWLRPAPGYAIGTLASFWLITGIAALM